MNDNTSDRYERGGPHDPDGERYGPQLDDLHEEELKRELRMEGSRLPKPKPTGNVCAKCVPIRLPAPSGRIRMKHAYDCPDHPGRWIPATEYVKKGRSWPWGWRR